MKICFPGKHLHEKVTTQKWSPELNCTKMKALILNSKQLSSKQNTVHKKVFESFITDNICFRKRQRHNRKRRQFGNVGPEAPIYYIDSGVIEISNKTWATGSSVIRNPVYSDDSNISLPPDYQTAMQHRAFDIPRASVNGSTDRLTLQQETTNKHSILKSTKPKMDYLDNYIHIPHIDKEGDDEIIFIPVKDYPR